MADFGKFCLKCTYFLAPFWQALIVWWCPKNNKYKVCFKECTFAHKMVGFKTFRALGKCRKTGIYGACIRPQGTLQNLSHKKLFNDITLQNDLSFLGVWKRVFMKIFFLAEVNSFKMQFHEKGRKWTCRKIFSLSRETFNEYHFTKWHKIYGAHPGSVILPK